jgi:hypothetical protein
MKEQNWVDSDEFVKANATSLSPECRDLLDKIFVADEFKRITLQVGWEVYSAVLESSRCRWVGKFTVLCWEVTLQVGWGVHSAVLGSSRCRWVGKFILLCWEVHAAGGLGSSQCCVGMFTVSGKIESVKVSCCFVGKLMLCC